MESESREKHVKTELGRCSRLALVLGPVLNGNSLEKQKDTFIRMKGLSGDLIKRMSTRLLHTTVENAVIHG